MDSDKKRIDSVYELFHDWRAESKENMRQSKILFVVMMVVLSLSGAGSLWAILMIIKFHYL